MRPMLQAILFDLDLSLGRPVGDLSFEDRQAHLYASVGLPYTLEQVKAALAARRGPDRPGAAGSPARGVGPAPGA